MRHRRLTSHFGRKSGPRKALLRNLVTSLVEHERIRTTLPKAKELRRHIERAITRGKGGTLHDQRILLSKYPNQSAVDKIMKDLGPRFKNRDGGYTRIIKLGTRPGDRAEMAFIEFVDYDFEKAQAAAQKPVKVRVRGADRKLTTKELAGDDLKAFRERQKLRADNRKKKTLQRIQKESRKESFARARA